MQLLLPSFHPSCTFPWKNLEELSLLWAGNTEKHSRSKFQTLIYIIVLLPVFTKCKQHVRDGFRIENMMWRLWYRQAIMQKRSEPRAPSLSIPSSPTAVRLSRTRSLPNLSRPLHQTEQQQRTYLQQQQQPQIIATTRRKFFIDDEEDDDVSDSESSISTNDSYWPATESAFSSCSSLPLGDEELFVKQCPSSRPRSSPVSTLSTLLQQRTPHNIPSTTLKRCESHFSHLDQWFTNTENPIH